MEQQVFFFCSDFQASSIFTKAEWKVLHWVKSFWGSSVNKTGYRVYPGACPYKKLFLSAVSPLTGDRYVGTTGQLDRRWVCSGKRLTKQLFQIFRTYPLVQEYEFLYFPTWYLSFIVLPCEYATRHFSAFHAQRCGLGLKWNVRSSLAGLWKSWAGVAFHF